MTIVYGGCIEPGGMKLDDELITLQCDHCGKETAVHRNWQAVEGGSINAYYSIHCESCGYHETNDPEYEDPEALSPEEQISQLVANGDITAEEAWGADPSDPRVTRRVTAISFEHEEFSPKPNRPFWRNFLVKLLQA